MGTIVITKPNCNVASIPYLLVIVVGAITFLVYYSGLTGPFVFDDGPNLVENKDLHISTLSRQELTTAMTTTVKAGSLNRPVSYLTFALNYYFFGDKPFSFKVFNVLIHVLIGLSLFVLTRLLLRAHRFARKSGPTKDQIEWVALTVSTLWLLHPLGLTSVLYIVQRMTSLSALFTILSLVCYLLVRLRLIAGRKLSPTYILGCFTFALLALFSKENAALIPYYILLIEICVLKFKTKSVPVRILLISLCSISIIPILGLLFQFDAVVDWLTHRYNLRPFTLSERLLTETRVMWIYIKLIFMPRLSELGLYQDDIPISTNLFTPLTTLGSILGLISLLVSTLILKNKAPIYSFGILFFLVGHSIESSIIPLEIAHEHRNYLPMFGLLLIIGYYSVHPRVLSIYKTANVLGLLVLLSMYTAITAQRVSQWANEGELAFSLAQHHPKSARSNYEAGRILTGMIEASLEDPVSHQRYYPLASEFFSLANKADRSSPSGLFGMLYLNSILGIPIKTNTLNELKTRLSEHPILPATANTFTSIHRCWVEERCVIDPHILAELFRTALTNELISANSRASLYNELAITELWLGKTKLALSLFEKAVDTAPGKPQLWFNFIQILISTGKTEQAESHLHHVKLQFSDPNSLQRIAHLENQLISR